VIAAAQQAKPPASADPVPGTPASTSSEERAAGADPSAPADTPSQQRLQLNLLGQTDTEGGESRRNENVQLNLIDRNAMR
jgi:hypothetical protein